MSLLHRIGWRAARSMQKRLSPYHAQRLAELFAGGNRPAGERQSHDCPLCGYSGPFEMFFGSDAIRFDAQCPRCKSRERHRFLKLWMDGDPRAGDMGEVLHFAPEPELRDDLVRRSMSYRTADITPGRADLVLDMEAIDLPDDSIDTVMANHVLEHVDDRKALSELWRILRPGGRAILTFPWVPFWESSYEDARITSPADRFRHFGQGDHVRYFGRDAMDRIRAAGFHLSTVTTDGAQAARHGLIRGDAIFLADKPAGPDATAVQE